MHTSKRNRRPVRSPFCPSSEGVAGPALGPRARDHSRRVPPLGPPGGTLRRKLAIVGALAGGAVLATASPAGAAAISPGEVQANLDNTFVLLSGVLVIFMQAGFALVEAGLTRAKGVANIMAKNMMDFCFGALAFFAVGFAIAFGGGFDGIGRFIGGGGWFLGDSAFAYGNLTPATFF